MSKTEVLLEFNERQSNCCCSHLKNVFVDGKATEASSSFADARWFVHRSPFHAETVADKRAEPFEGLPNLATRWDGSDRTFAGGPFFPQSLRDFSRRKYRHLRAENVSKCGVRYLELVFGSRP